MIYFLTVFVLVGCLPLTTWTFVAKIPSSRYDSSVVHRFQKTGYGLSSSSTCTTSLGITTTSFLSQRCFFLPAATKISTRILAVPKDEENDPMGEVDEDLDDVDELDIDDIDSDGDLKVSDEYYDEDEDDIEYSDDDEDINEENENVEDDMKEEKDEEEDEDNGISPLLSIPQVSRMAATSTFCHGTNT